MSENNNNTESIELYDENYQYNYSDTVRTVTIDAILRAIFNLGICKKFILLVEWTHIIINYSLFESWVVI